jgi:hypothetical protein
MRNAMMKYVVNLGGWRLLTAASLLGGAAGCLSTPAGRIDPPQEILRGRNDNGDGRGRYVVRMTDGDQDWEVTIPEIGTAYEVSIPLKGAKGGPGGIVVEQPTLTAADREIVGQRQIDARARADEPPAMPIDATAVSEEGYAPRPQRPRPIAGVPAGSTSPKASYLLTLAKVKDLYKGRNYELALVELVALEKEYPDDERIMSMKGSLYEKVGRRQLAREAWEAVMALNPYNLQVAEALQRLGKGSGGQ